MCRIICSLFTYIKYEKCTNKAEKELLAWYTDTHTSNQRPKWVLYSNKRLVIAAAYIATNELNLLGAFLGLLCEYLFVHLDCLCDVSMQLYVCRAIRDARKNGRESTDPIFSCGQIFIFNSQRMWNVLKCKTLFSVHERHKQMSCLHSLTNAPFGNWTVFFCWSAVEWQEPNLFRLMTRSYAIKLARNVCVQGTKKEEMLILVVTDGRRSICLAQWRI